MAFSYHCKCEGYAANCSYLGHVPNAFGAEHLCRTSTLVERVGCTERGRGAGSQGQTCGGRKAFVMSHKKPSPLKTQELFETAYRALALKGPSDRFPSPSQVPPNGTLKPRCPPPSPGLLLLVKLPRTLEQCQVDANSVTASLLEKQITRATTAAC